MGKGLLLMSGKERARKGVLDEVLAGGMSLRDASERIGVCYRQAKRVVKRYREEGDGGLVHQSRGRPSSRAKAPALREAVLEQCCGRLKGLGPTLASEKLAEEGLVVDHETLRRWMIEDGQWQHRRKRGRHRSRRERKARFGQMLQLDGSHHRWFGEEQAQCCLMTLIDDATGTTLSCLFEQETTEAAMRVLWRWVERYGIPGALYLDRKSVYLAMREPTPEEQLAGKEPLTAFGVACQKLGIKLITAHSPQAKGRVERSHGLYQDRFFHELRLQGIRDIAAANRLLENSFCDMLNEKFARPPREPKDAHRRLPPRTDLRDVFCIDTERTVSNDWCIRHENRHYQIAKLNTPLPKPKEKVLVRQWLDGTVHLLHKEQRLTYTQLQEPPRKEPKPSKSNPMPAQKRKPPAYDHPWRKSARSGQSP